MTFSLTTAILVPLNAHVRIFGDLDSEAGGFLLGPRDAAVANVLALADGVGVERSRGVFQVSGKAIEQLFAWTDDHQLRVWALVHSHPRGSSLSRTDELYGFRVAGFLSGVIPDFARPPLHPHEWGWWTFDAEEWRGAHPPDLVAGEALIISFDETGVR